MSTPRFTRVAAAEKRIETTMQGLSDHVEKYTGTDTEFAHHLTEAVKVFDRDLRKRLAGKIKPR